MAQVAAERAMSANGKLVPQELSDRYSHALRIVRVMFVELQEIITDGDEVSDVEWASWSMQWAAEMGALLKLVEARDAELLTVYQEALLGDILTHLECERPRLIELKLAHPFIPPRQQ